VIAMMCRQVSCYAVSFVLVLGGLVPSASATAQTGYKPCSLVSVGETEALAGAKIVKWIERHLPHKKGNGYDSEGVNSLCPRWLAGGRIFLLTVGAPMTEGVKVQSVDSMLSRQAREKIQKLGGTWKSKLFGEITCTTVDISSNPGLGTTTCAALKVPLFRGDGFDGTASLVGESLLIILQITAGPKGLISMDEVHALAEKLLERMQ
jgi:hypothetical protein